MSKSTLNCSACGAGMGRESTCGECGWTYNSEFETVDAVDQVLELDRSHMVASDFEQTADSSPANQDSLKAELQLPPDAHQTAVSSSPSTAPSARTEASTVMTELDLWWEVAAVLAVGVIPYLPGILSHEYSQKSWPPYWIGFISLFMHSVSSTFVTLYLIHRSGEPWERFGIPRFCASDPFLGVFLVMVAWIVYVLWWHLTGGMGSANDDLFPVPKSRLDFVLMIVGYSVSGLSEEVVTRAYLITRLKRLLRSRLAAVLVAAALFASYHLYQGLGGAFHALLFGLAYGAAFLWLRSVWPLAIGHALINIYFELLSSR